VVRLVADNGCFWVLNVGLDSVSELQVRRRGAMSASVVSQLSTQELEPLGQLVVEASMTSAHTERVRLEASWVDGAGVPRHVAAQLPADGMTF
jgi:hypothetical protein